MSKSKAKILSLPITNHANYNAETERQENVIGARIDEARRKAGLSLVDFSALLRQYGVTMSPSGINKWAKGSALPNAYQLVAVCHALDLDVDVSYFCSSHTPALNDAGLAKVREYKDDLIASGKYKPQPKVVSILKYIEMPVSNLRYPLVPANFSMRATLRWLAFPKSQFQRVLILVYGFPAIVWSLFIMTVRLYGSRSARPWPLERSASLSMMAMAT